MAAGAERAAPRSAPRPGQRRGRESSGGVPGAAAPGFPQKLSRSLRQGAQPAAAACGCGAGESHEPPAAQHEVSREPPRVAEVRRAGWPRPEGGVGGSFGAPGDPLGRRCECQANFRKLLPKNLRRDLHGWGPGSGRVRPAGNAGRSSRLVTGNFPASLSRGPLRPASSFILPSSADVGALLCWRARRALRPAVSELNPSPSPPPRECRSRPSIASFPRRWPPAARRPSHPALGAPSLGRRRLRFG